MMVTTFFATLAIVATGFQTTSTPESEFETALGTAALSTRTAVFDNNLMRFFRLGEFTTPIYDTTSENPWRIPFIMKTFRADMATQAGRVHDSLSSGAQLTGFPIRRSLLGNPIESDIQEAKKPDSLMTKLKELERRGVISEIPNLDQIPVEVRQATCLILRVLDHALDHRKAAFSKLGDLQPIFKMFEESNGAESGAAFNSLLQVYRNTDLSYLAAGAYDLFLAVQTASTLIGTVPSEKDYDLVLPTVWGAIRLSGGRDTQHPEKPYLLIIDTGGNDTYLNAGATLSATNWSSLVIDSDGSDRYVSHNGLLTSPMEKWSGRQNRNNRPGPGGALLGYAMIYDTDGNDLYRSHLPSMGSGRLGMGAICDTVGDDQYDAYADSQGFGFFGVGILEDLRGIDHYYGFTQVQGHGNTAGFGYLVDRAGDDEYLANDQVIDFPSAQSSAHNVSMAQGAGHGRRGDYLDGHTLAGGVGILFDMAGKDKYSCGVFGQGVGYGKGAGFMWDSEGDDSYYGQWYVQGASAHYALGAFEDLAGKDTYSAIMNMALGAGHDFGVGLFMDHSGDDVYVAPNLSLGAGNANGIGIFVELLGNDQYKSSGITLGRAAEATKASLRARCLCLGLFMDLAGEDSYPGSAIWAANGTRVANWTDRGLTPQESQLGIFWDR